MAKKMNIGKKILVGVVIAAAAVGFMLATPQGREVIDTIFPGTTQVKKTQLQTPSQFSFVNDTRTLTWEGVENATEYSVNFTSPDGSKYSYEVALPSYTLPNYFGAEDGEIFNFSVVAKGDSTYYKNSEAGTYSHTVTNMNEQYWQKAYKYVYNSFKEILKFSELERRFELTELLALEVDGTNVNVVFSGTKSGIESLVTATIDLSSIASYTDGTFDSLSSVRHLLGGIATLEGSKVTITSNVEINQNLDVTEGLAKSEESGLFADYTDAGYTITSKESVVTNIREDNGNYMFDVFGVYKATHENGDVIYFSANNSVSIPMDQEPTTDYIDYFNQTGNGTVVENDGTVEYNDSIQEVLEELFEMRQEVLEQQATQQP